MTSSTISRFRLHSRIGQRQQKNQCELCEHKFQLIIHQEHQCKRCLRSICQKCVSGRVKIYGYEGQSASFHKCCLVCRYEQDLVTALIQDNNLVFRTSSRISDDWVKRQNKSRQSFQNIINEYEEKKWVQNDNVIKAKAERIKLSELLYRQFNYSVRQFVARIIESIKPQMVESSIKNVLVSIYAQLKNISYTPQLIPFILFLLCFCNESQCYFIVTRFIGKTFPQYQKLDTNRDITHQLRTLTEMYGVLANRPDRTELKKVTVFLEHSFLNFVKGFTINYTNVAISFYLIDEMLSNNSYMYLYKGIAALVFMCKNKLTIDGQIGTVYNHLVGGINLDKFKNVMICFQRSNVKFQMVHEFFDSAEHRKLFEKYKLLEDMHHKMEDKCKSLQISNEQLKKELSTVSEQLDSTSLKKMDMEEQLLKLADKVILAEEVQSLKNRNKILIDANQNIETQFDLLTKKYEDLNKQYTIQQVTRKMYLRMQDDYQKQIVELKTKNELYEIEKLANNIEFETSYIDRKFEQKNNKIATLEKEIHKMQIQLDFYRNYKERKYSAGDIRSRKQSLNDDLFGNISMIGKSEISYKQNGFDEDINMLQTSRDDPEGFKKLVYAARQTINKLKSDLTNVKAEKQLLHEQVKKLSQKLAVQSVQAELINQMKDFLNQIPQQTNYLEDIELLEQFKVNQNNIHKKTQLEKIVTSFRKCYNEVKYRTMDAKLKQNKIKLIKKDIKKQQNDLKGDDQNLTDLLKWFGSTEDIIELNKKVLKKEQACLIM